MFTFKICGLQYSSKSGYNKYVKTKQENRKNITMLLFINNNCNKLFTNKKNLTAHIKNKLKLIKTYKYICSFKNYNEKFK